MPLTLDVPAVLAVLVFGTLYVRATRRRTWPPGRTAAFLAGLATIVVVTCSPLAVYDTTFFWVRAVQTITLLMITPLLLALGSPIRLLLDTVPARWPRRHGRGPLARALTFPPVVTLALVVPLLVLYLTPLYDLTLRSPVADGLVRLALVLAGFTYFWTRLGLDPTPRRDPHLVSVWIAFTEVIFDGALGLVLWLGPLLAPAHYAAAHPGRGPDPRTDQIIGAGVLWIGGDVAGLPFVVALFVRWARDDERRAKQIDVQLDEEAASGAASTSGLWWENDPALAERFRERG
ncbi:Cytochrome c oxidase caa3-type assembly factor CtaG_BS (unrelated to Cox11-CtaG family) [Amycolatopsis camponoti]|uniref:Cytochrome c oxidase caa3-type assembly factor CtaG_BS (Unrelated to Cox11-CtaG family) n=1 Tax=Amycolatopsis camponoti TaxID=2606593 RepID=A0A6I8MB63_9PSEU|nr:cytochrome c oxidase assembly protein [Amycolatopsis camponoti]VVJ25368.1 Cytochrome c oxidase caa3-type assembly factor CtaG_BS (unrelated to Cox11-CtaG family) [Amycolatopsis camponoti]